MRPLICDLDGVIRRWDPAIISSAENAAGLPAGALSGAAFGDRDLLQQAITGVITDEGWRQRIAANLDRSHGSGGHQAVGQWSASAGEVDHDVIDLLAEERMTRPVVLLTNATTRLHSDLARLGLTHHFDRIFNSSELGLAKPDPSCFQRVAEGLGAAPRDCWFVDDSQLNVAAAAALGMHVHHFTTTARLAEWLRSPRDR